MFKETGITCWYWFIIKVIQHILYIIFETMQYARRFNIRIRKLHILSYLTRINPPRIMIICSNCIFSINFTKIFRFANLNNSTY